MSGFKFSRKSALLLAGLIAAHCAAPVALAQTVGPIQPAPPPQQAPNKVVDGLTKFFGKKKEENQANPESKPDGDDKPVVVTPAEGLAPAAATPSPAAEEIRSYKRPPMLTQPELTSVKIEPAQMDPENPPVYNHPRLDDPNNPLGFTDAENRLRHIMSLIDNQRIYEAKSNLVPLRQWLVDSTEAHINLYKVLNTVSSARAQAELEKQLALEFAQLRDQAMLEMGKIYIAEKEYQKAVKELTEVIKSQPRSQLGIRSYELLQEIGFTQKLQLAQ